MITATMMVISIALFLIRVPVSIALGVATLVGFWTVSYTHLTLPTSDLV